MVHKFMKETDLIGLKPGLRGKGQGFQLGRVDEGRALC